MKRIRMLTILVLALGFIISPAKVSEAGPMGTSFTYNGRLMDTGSLADGLYDFLFALYDDSDPNVGNQVGDAVFVNEFDVIDGYFTVELDFGAEVFNGDARWLEIGIRPGGSGGGFTTLRPRQKVMPTPYALYAASGTRGPRGAQGPPGASLFVDDGNDVYYVGIGTTEPNSALEVNGTITGTVDANQAVYGINTNSGNAGSLGGSNYGVKSEGDLVVDGNDAAFRGTIGPNNGAPFPRPAYDSGWMAGTGGMEIITLLHNIGGNVDNYVVDVQRKLPDRLTKDTYQDLRTNSVKVFVSANFLERIRIWVYN